MKYQDTKPTENVWTPDSGGQRGSLGRRRRVWAFADQNVRKKRPWLTELRETHGGREGRKATPLSWKERGSLCLRRACDGSYVSLLSGNRVFQDICILIGSFGRVLLFKKRKNRGKALKFLCFSKFSSLHS